MNLTLQGQAVNPSDTPGEVFHGLSPGAVFSLADNSGWIKLADGKTMVNLSAGTTQEYRGQPIVPRPNATLELDP